MKKWVKFKRSGLFADELLYDQERCVTNYIMSQAKSDFEDKLVNQIILNVFGIILDIFLNLLVL